MESNIKISIIVPIYNVETYLERCLESIVSQSYNYLEIILVDDGSTDSSGIICDSFAKNDDRIKVIHKENGGAVSARKKGALAATGDYVIQVDGDDWIERNRIKNIVEDGLFDFPDIVCSGGIYLEYPEECRLKELPTDVCGLHATEEIWRNPNKYLMSEKVFIKKYLELSLCTCCIKRENYIYNQLELDDNVALGQDQIVVLACIMASKTIRTIFNPTYHYILHREGAISYRKTSYPENAAKIYYQCMKNYIELYHISNRDVMDILSKYVFNTVMLTNYKLIYDAFTHYLFPYAKVKNDSRIIVYGAGNLGVEIVNAIDSDNRFEIVAWVDKTRTKHERSSHMIESPKIIVEREFDYIIVSVMNAEVSIQIREELAKIVDVNKVVLMGYDNMSMKRLDEIFSSK